LGYPRLEEYQKNWCIIGKWNIVNWQKLRFPTSRGWLLRALLHNTNPDKIVVSLQGTHPSIPSNVFICENAGAASGCICNISGNLLTVG
jgi:hypothetical protein